MMQFPETLPAHAVPSRKAIEARQLQRAKGAALRDAILRWRLPKG